MNGSATEGQRASRHCAQFPRLLVAPPTRGPHFRVAIIHNFSRRTKQAWPTRTRSIAAMVPRIRRTSRKSRQSLNISKIYRLRAQARRRFSSGNPSPSWKCSSTSRQRCRGRSSRSPAQDRSRRPSDQGVHFLIDLSYAGLYGLRNSRGSFVSIPADRGAAPALPFARRLSPMPRRTPAFQLCSSIRSTSAPPIWPSSRRRRESPAQSAPAVATAPVRSRSRLPPKHPVPMTSPATHPTRPRKADDPAYEPSQGGRDDRRADPGQPHPRFRPRDDLAGLGDSGVGVFIWSFHSPTFCCGSCEGHFSPACVPPVRAAVGDATLKTQAFAEEVSGLPAVLLLTPHVPHREPGVIAAPAP